MKNSIRSGALALSLALVAGVPGTAYGQTAPARTNTKPTAKTSYAMQEVQSWRRTYIEFVKRLDDIRDDHYDPRGFDLAKYTQAVIRSANPAAVEMFRKDLALYPDYLTQEILDNVLAQAVSANGLNHSDMLEAEYGEKSAPTQYEMARILIAKGARDSSRDGFLLYSAAFDGRLPLARLLVERGISDPKMISVDAYKGGDGSEYRHSRTPIDTAAYNGRIDIVRYLGSKGARPAENVDMPSLILKTLEGDVAMVRALLESGASRDARDRQGNTAADYLKPGGPAFPDRNGRPSRPEYPAKTHYWQQWGKKETVTYKYDDEAGFRAGPEAAAIRALLAAPAAAPAPEAPAAQR